MRSPTFGGPPEAGGLFDGRWTCGSEAVTDDGRYELSRF
jgi:hypothetical protein